jgi:hypothetical protein
MTSMTTTSIRALTYRSAPAGPLFVPCLSTGTLPGSMPGEQAGDRLLGVGQFLLAAPQGGLKCSQLCMQIRPRSRLRVLAHVCASCGPYVDQALGREQPDGGLGCVLGDVMCIPELPVRRHPGARWVCPVPDPGPESLREAFAREAVGIRRGHSASITDCLKTVNS